MSVNGRGLAPEKRRQSVAEERQLPRTAALPVGNRPRASSGAKNSASVNPVTKVKRLRSSETLVSRSLLRAPYHDGRRTDRVIRIIAAA